MTPGALTERADVGRGASASAGPAAADLALRGAAARGWTALQLRVLLFGAVILFCDGYDLLSISYAAPHIRSELQLGSVTMGQIFSVALLGMIAGGMLLGPLADRLGPRGVTTGSLLLAGIATLLLAFADSAGEIMILRFLSGIGLGGAMPGAFALAGDFSRSAHKRTTLAVVGVAFGLGGAAAGAISVPLLNWAGWHAIFLFGGVITIAVSLLMALFLPQGLSFLVERGATAQLLAILKRLPHGVTVNAKAEDRTASTPRIPVKVLFEAGWWRLTVGLWGASFLMLLTYYLLINWLPTMLAERRSESTLGGQALTLLQLGMAGGGLAVGIAMDRWTSRLLIFWAASLTAISAMGAALLAETGGPLVLCCLLLGFFSAATQGALNYTATLAYPPAARVTGIAGVLSIGRIGALFGPLLGGVMLAQNVSLSAFFLTAGVTAMLAGLVLLIMVLASRGDEGAAV